MMHSNSTRKWRIVTLSIGVTAALALLPALATTANAAPGDSGGHDLAANVYFTYDSANPGAGATITWTHENENLVFPETVEDEFTLQSFTVTGIGDDVGQFQGEFDRVVIPDSVTEVFPGAFATTDPNNFIGTLELGDGLTEIADETFYRSNIQNVELPSTVTTIGNNAFGRNDLTSLTLPASLSTIGDSAFADNKLTSLTYPATVTTAGSGIFARNELSSVTIADGVTAIPEGAFEQNNLTSVTLPNSVTSIGNGAFAQNNISNLDLGSGVTEIGEGAFVDNKLAELTLPASLQHMGVLAFAYNEIAQINFAEGLTEIGANVFPGNQLSSLELPSTVTTIGDGAFADNQFTELTLPNQITTIRSGAFMGNQLTKVTLGNKVDDLGESVFGDNLDLSRVIFTGPTPSSIFPGDSEDASLGSNSGLVVLYQPQFGLNSTPNGFTSPRWQGYYAFPVSATVTFVTNGGSTVESKIVNFGDLLALPTAPVKVGNAFTGWFTNKELTTKFYANDMINADLTLYAGWKADGTVKPNPGGPGGPGTKPGASSGLPNTGGSNAELMAAVAAAGVLLAAGATMLARRKSAPKQ